jgi:hypothetical protein
MILPQLHPCFLFSHNTTNTYLLIYFILQAFSSKSDTATQNLSLKKFFTLERVQNSSTFAVKI